MPLAFTQKDFLVHFYLTELSINCTFEDHNNCGYRQIFIGSFYHWVRFPADDYNLLPDFDKTFGNKTGNKFKRFIHN